MINGRVPCPQCGRFVKTSSDGLQWHLKTTHGVKSHSDACEISESVKLALAVYAPHQSESSYIADPATRFAELGAGVLARPDPADRTAAQADPAVLHRMIAEGRVQSLGPGLDACCSGDIETLKAEIQAGWDPVTARDKHGSGALLWAAGGGHLAVCKFLVNECKVDAEATAEAGARRGYRGRSALHWAARNGHLEVVEWNSYGCNAALWAAQGGSSLELCRFLHRLGVDWHRINANGQGALHKAAQRGRRDVCEWLLSAEVGLDWRVHLAPNLAEGSGPAELARLTGHSDLAVWLAARQPSVAEDGVAFHNDAATGSSSVDSSCTYLVPASESTLSGTLPGAAQPEPEAVVSISKRKQRALAKKAEKRAKRELYRLQDQKAKRRAPTGPGASAPLAPPAAASAHPVEDHVRFVFEELGFEGEIERFHRDGYCVVRRALAPDVLTSFRAQIEEELRDPTIPQQQCAAVDLSTVESWPSGGARRVIECVPAGAGKHWDRLIQSTAGGDIDNGDEHQHVATPLAAALDRLLGPGGWELPLNPTGAHSAEGFVRHWYCPIVFPECNPLDRKGDPRLEAIRRDANRNGWRPWDESEDRELKAIVRKQRRNEGSSFALDWGSSGISLPTRGSSECRERWSELEAKPWSPDEDQKLLGIFHTRGPAWGTISQLLSGRNKRHVRRRMTVLVVSGVADAFFASIAPIAALPPPAAHRWRAVNRRRVRDKGWHVDIGPGFDTDWTRTIAGHRYQGCVVLVLLSDCPAGHGGTAFIPGSHLWVRDHLSAVEAAGKACSHQELNSWSIATVAQLFAERKLRMSYESEVSAPHVIEQMVGRAGDVWLVHPWLIHSGTTNYGTAPRVMANGMARISAEAFGRIGNPVLRAIVNCDPCGPDLDGDNNAIGSPLKRAKRSVSLPDGLASAELPSMNAPSCNVSAAASSAVRVVDSTLPCVSIVMPVHDGLRRMDNGVLWLDAALNSVLTQTYMGPIEVSIFDDASTDGSGEAIRAWAEVLRNRGFEAVVTGSCWDGRSQPAGGIGYAKNKSAEQSTGEFLCFLDVDDEMYPTRIERQLVASMANPMAIVGGGLVRDPPDATVHWMWWANGMEPDQLWLQQFRETTVLMPTWFIPRQLYDAVGGFREAPPSSGEAEDLRFFLKHLAMHGEANRAAGLRSIVRVGDADSPVLLYRWTAGSGTARVSRRQHLTVRTVAFEDRILDGNWAGRSFMIWGAGRDAKHFLTGLKPATQARIRALIDLDHRKVGHDYVNGALGLKIPVVHFEHVALSGVPVPGGGSPEDRAVAARDPKRAARGPVVVCVSLRRASNEQGGALETNVATLGLTEGEDLWFII